MVINMKLPGDDGRRTNSHSIFYMIIGVSAFVLVLLLVVMQNNGKSKKGSGESAPDVVQQEAAAEPEVAEPESEQKLRAEDLSFWGMYPPEGNKTEKPQTDAQDEDSQNETEEESGTDAEKKEEVVQEDPSENF